MRIIAVLALLTLAISGLTGCETEAPQAQFSYRVIPAFNGFGVQFIDQSTGDINAWE